MKPFTLCAFADEASDRLSEQICALTENGLQGVELRNVDGKSVTALTAAEAKEIKKQLDAAGLRVWSLGSPIGKVELNADFSAHLASFRHLLELSEILDADCIRLFSFFIRADENPDEVRPIVLERMDAFLRAAEGYRVTLCHENEKDIFGDTIERCLTLHKTFPALKAVFDPANFIQCGQDTVKAYDTLAPYVHYLHIKDALADGTVVPAGKGIGNIPYLLKRTSSDVLTIEPHLFDFIGLDALEQGDSRLRIQGGYPNARAAFDDAVNQLKRLLLET